GVVRQRRERAARLAHFLGRVHVLAEEAKRTPVPPALRRDAVALTVSNDARQVRIERPLRLAAHLAEIRAVGLAPAPGDADPEVLERAVHAGERAHEQSARELLGIREVAITDVAAVGRAVEDARGIADRTAEQVAEDLDADVAVADQVGGQAALHEADVSA